MARRQVTLALIKSRCTINPKTECWEWANCLQANGYGRINANRKSQYVHRLAFELAHGAIPTGLDVCHECDNRKCCNPDHLFSGTRKVNMRDAKSKGRLSCGIRHSLKVEKHVRARSKLSMEIARTIRALKLSGERTDSLATIFKVDISTIRLVIREKIWREPKSIFNI